MTGLGSDSQGDWAGVAEFLTEPPGTAWSLSCNWDIAAAAKSLQSCPTLCDPIDGSPPGSLVHGVFQARVLEWGAIAFSNRDVTL